MSYSSDHQTSVFMNENAGNFRDSMQQPDVASGGRLLSQSEEEKGHARVRMTRPAKRRVWVIIGVMTAFIVIIAIILIALLASSPKQENADSESEHLPPPLPISDYHVRCKHDVNISEGTTRHNWKHYDSTMHVWRQLPDVQHTGFVLVSPRMKLEAGHPGILVSLQTPGNNTKFHVMAVTKQFKHTPFVTLKSGSDKCDSVAIDDPKFFSGNGTIFKVYIYYKSPIKLKGIKSTVTSLPAFARYKAFGFHKKTTTRPTFTTIRLSERDKCSSEIRNQYDRDCNWWNLEDGDTTDFVPDDNDVFPCIDRGEGTVKSDIYYLGFEPKASDHETRSLLISPIIKRQTPTVLLTMWYILKCTGSHIRIHRIPAERSSLREAMGSSTVIAEINDRAGHLAWEFRSFIIPLPTNHSSYHLVIEGIAARDGNCSQDICSENGVHAGEHPRRPFVGVDSLAIELMHERCSGKGSGNVMDCKFQTNASEPTMCEWDTSYPFDVHQRRANNVSEEFIKLFRDWKIVASGYGDDHGATAQHFEGRGHIIKFDASGRNYGYVRTPVIIAEDNCSCVMKFDYLMRGNWTPRMQINIIYGADYKDKTRPLEPQFSVFGHQSDDWLVAAFPINLRVKVPFQIEIRTLDISSSRSDLYIDDIDFIGCDMKKYP